VSRRGCVYVRLVSSPDPGTFSFQERKKHGVLKKLLVLCVLDLENCLRSQIKEAKENVRPEGALTRLLMRLFCSVIKCSYFYPLGSFFCILMNFIVVRCVIIMCLFLFCLAHFATVCLIKSLLSGLCVS